MIKVDIAISTYRGVMAVECAKSLFNLDRQELFFNLLDFPDETNLGWKRNEMIEQFLKGDSEYIFFVDDDQVFPPDTVQRLINHNKAICGGVYVQRRPPYLPTVYVQRLFLMHHISDFPRDKIFKVDVAACGCMLVRRDVLESLRPPWFDYTVRAGHNRSEDVYFCESVRKAGFDIWMDPTLEVGHIEQRVVTLDNYVPDPEKRI